MSNVSFLQGLEDKLERDLISFAVGYYSCKSAFGRLNQMNKTCYTLNDTRLQKLIIYTSTYTSTCIHTQMHMWDIYMYACKMLVISEW